MAKVASPKLSKTDCERIYGEARETGLTALRACEPTPMRVVEHNNPLYGLLPNQQSGGIKNEWIVEDGPCGFAWVQIYPGNSKFANWIKQQGLGRTDSYNGGVQIWVDEGEQSMQRKEAYAKAFAKILKDNGITAYAGSRLD